MWSLFGDPFGPKIPHNILTRCYIAENDICSFRQDEEARFAAAVHAVRLLVDDSYVVGRTLGAVIT